MVEKLLEQLRKIDINNCAEKFLNEAREMKTIDEAEAFLKDKLNGKHLELTLKILKEEVSESLEELEAVGIFSKSIDEPAEPFTDDQRMLELVIDKCKDGTIHQAMNVMGLLGVSEAGQNYVIKEIKKIKRDNYKKEEAERLKPASTPEKEK